MFSHKVADAAKELMINATCLFSFSIFFFFSHRLTAKNEKQVVLQKSSSSRVTIVNRIPSPEIQQNQKLCGSAGKTECKSFSWRHRRDGQARRKDSSPNTNDNKTEIWWDFFVLKKKKAPRKKSVQRRFFFASVQSRKDSDGEVRIAGDGGHLNMFVLCCQCRCFRPPPTCNHSIQSPSSNSDSSSESEYSTAMRRERMVATSLPTRSCLASCSRCSSTFRSCMPGGERSSDKQVKTLMDSLISLAFS